MLLVPGNEGRLGLVAVTTGIKSLLEGRRLSGQSPELQPGQGQLPVLQVSGDPLMPLKPLQLQPQGPNLALHLPDNVVDPFQVLAGGLQLPLGRPALLLVLIDARRFFEHPAPVILHIRQNGLDHIQLDDRISVASHTGVHEQVHDVLQPTGITIDQKLALSIAVEAAADLNVGVLQGKRGLVVMECEGDFAEAGRLVAPAAVKNDLIHAGAAKNALLLLSKNPAEGVDNIGLAAAVGAYYPCYALTEGHARPLTKGLEPVEDQTRDIHGRATLG
ncbi:hypothetical protein ES703_101710 [subsurface metagenome]